MFKKFKKKISFDVPWYCNACDRHVENYPVKSNQKAVTSLHAPSGNKCTDSSARGILHYEKKEPRTSPSNIKSRVRVWRCAVSYHFTRDINSHRSAEWALICAVIFLRVYTGSRSSSGYTLADVTCPTTHRAVLLARQCTGMRSTSDCHRFIPLVGKYTPCVSRSANNGPIPLDKIYNTRVARLTAKLFIFRTYPRTNISRKFRTPVTGAKETSKFSTHGRNVT